MNIIFPFIAILLLTLSGCATQSSQPYDFYSKETPSSSEPATISVDRPFGGPALLFKYVDSRFILDYPSMKDYDPNTARSIEPRTIRVAPGRHTLQVVFSYTDVTNKVQMVSMLATIGVAPVAYSTLRKYAEIGFTTGATKRYTVKYLWDKSQGAEGIKFLVDECSSDGSGCKTIPIGVDKERAEILPGIQKIDTLYAR